MLDTMSSLIYGDDDFKDKDKPSSEKNVFFFILTMTTKIKKAKAFTFFLR